MLYVADGSSKMKTEKEFIGFNDIKISISDDTGTEPDWSRLKNEEE